MPSMQRSLAVIFLVASVGGCVSEGDRRIVEDLRQIGERVEGIGTKAQDAEIEALGLDGRLGAETLQRNLTGGPPTPQTYTPKNARSNRDASDAAKAQRDAVSGSIMGFVGKATGLDVASVLAIIGALTGSIISSRRSARAKLEAVETGKEADVAVKSATFALDAIPDGDVKTRVLGSMKLLQEASGVRDRIRARI